MHEMMKIVCAKYAKVVCTPKFSQAAAASDAVPVTRKWVTARSPDAKNAEAVQKHNQRFTNDTFVSLLLC